MSLLDRPKVKPQGARRVNLLNIVGRMPPVGAPIKTHCKRGHPRTPENLTSSNQCRICQRESVKKDLSMANDPMLAGLEEAWKVCNETAMALYALARELPKTDPQRLSRLTRYHGAVDCATRLRFLIDERKEAQRHG